MNKDFTGMESVECAASENVCGASDFGCMRSVSKMRGTAVLLFAHLNQLVLDRLLVLAVFFQVCCHSSSLDAQMVRGSGLSTDSEVTTGQTEGSRETVDAFVLVGGLIESDPAMAESSGVYIDRDRVDAVNDPLALIQDGRGDAQQADTLADIIDSAGDSQDTVRIRNASQYDLGQEKSGGSTPSVKRKAVSSDRSTFEDGTTKAVQYLPDTGVTKLVSQTPLIDEPLGSGLATPLVAGGSVPPPPVLLDRLPPPARKQESYEILPNSTTEPVGGDTFIQPGELPADDSAVVWIDEASGAVKQTPRHRHFLRRMNQRLEPLRPLNLCDQGLYFATEFTFLSSNQVAKSQVDVADLLSDVDHSVESTGAFGYGQRGILGLQGEVFGFEVIYWDYGSRGYESGSWKPPYLFEQYTRGQSVDLSTLDLEITQKFCIAGVDWGTAIGLRKMDYVGHSSAFSLATYHDQQVEVSSSALAKNRLEGIGPTFAIRGRKSISRFCDQGTYGTGLFWDTRLSWLWSDSSSSAITEASAVSTTYDNPTVSRSLDYAYTISDDPELQMHAGLQLGVECWRSVGCRSRLIARAAFEYQYFEQSDDYSMANSYAYLTDSVNFGAAASALAENSGKDLNMFGFSLMVGVNY